MKKNDIIPTEEECYDIMDRYNMRPNIVDHSIQVKNVSLAITDNLKDPSSVNRDLVVASSLLHDIAKTRSIETGEIRHDLIGGMMLREMGMAAIAYVCEQHVMFEDFSFTGPLEEREIVFYADKRVMHDRIVTVEERVDDLVKRYGFNDKVKKLIRDNRDFVYRLEEKIQGLMTLSIDEAIAGL